MTFEYRRGQATLGGARLRRTRGGHGCVACLGHLGEGLLLVSVPHHLHEIGNEIVAALQLHVDLAPGRLPLVAAADQAVVGGHQPQPDSDDDAQDDPSSHARSSVAALLAGAASLVMIVAIPGG